MTQNEKDLLLKDLCARLPYGVKVRYSSYYEFITCTLQAINPVYNTIDLWSKDACFNPVFIDKIKPYLFPLSSMTEEQGDEYNSLRSIGVDECGDIIYFDTFESVDWCNKNHFDYRNLIGKNLAIDCTNLNIY